MVEIREFLDSDGQMTGSEVVNLSEEAKNLGPMDEEKMDEVMEKLQKTVVGADPATALDVSVTDRLKCAFSMLTPSSYFF